MDVKNLGHCFTFDDNLIITNEISKIVVLDRYSLIENREMPFSLERDVSHAHFYLKSILIYLFNKSTSELFVYFHCCSDDSVTFVFKYNLRHRCVVVLILNVHLITNYTNFRETTALREPTC